MTPQPDQRPPATGNVPPQPVPVSYEAQIINQPGGAKLIALVFHAPTGNFITFWSPEAVQELAQRLTGIATHAKSGLLVADHLPPEHGRANGHGGHV